MPERVVTCGDCGAKATIADGDWNSLQLKALEDWRAHHSQEVHDGQSVDALSLEPEPGNDAAPDNNAAPSNGAAPEVGSDA